MQHPHDPQPDRSPHHAALIRLKRNGATLLLAAFTVIAALMIMGSHDNPEAWPVFNGGLAAAVSAVVMIVAVGALDGHAGIIDTQEDAHGLLRQVLANQNAIRADIAEVRTEMGELRTEVAQAREESAVVSERVTVAEQHLGDRLDSVVHRTREQTGLIGEALARNVRRIPGGGYTETTPPGGTPRPR